MEPFNCSDIINGFEFERYLSAWLNSVGFQANVTKASHDDGVDVIAINPNTKSKYYIQCKLQFKKLSNKPIQEIYAATALNGNDGTPVVWTNNLFSDGAKDYARKLGVILIGKTETNMLNEVILGKPRKMTYPNILMFEIIDNIQCITHSKEIAFVKTVINGLMNNEIITITKERKVLFTKLSLYTDMVFDDSISKIHELMVFVKQEYPNISDNEELFEAIKRDETFHLRAVENIEWLKPKPVDPKVDAAMKELFANVPGVTPTNQCK